MVLKYEVVVLTPAGYKSILLNTAEEARYLIKNIIPRSEWDV